MKKILLSIIVLLMTFGIVSKVEAKSYNITLNGNSNFSDEITITLQINNQQDMSSYCNGICGLMATLKYDSSKIELVKLTELNDFEITHNSKDGTLVIERDTGAKNGTKIGTFKFRNKSLDNNESTTISLTNLTGTDGESDITTQNVSKKITYIKKTTNNNSTTTNTNTSKKEETKKKSNNNYLSSLNIESINFEFEKDKLIYDIVVKYDTDKIFIEAQTEDKNATIEGLGYHNLNIGKNSIKILVKSEDNTEREYVLNINREEQDVKIEENDTTDITIEENDDTITIKKRDLIIVILINIIIIIVGINLLLKRKK